MDQAVFASNPNLIIGIRGSRLFQCNATTGAVVTTADIGTVGWGKSCLAYDSGSNKVFCSTWNTPEYVIKHIGFFDVPVSERNFYRINPSTLAVELATDFQSNFGVSESDSTLQEVGICAMDSSGGNIFCRWWAAPHAGGSTGGSLMFSAANVATFHNGNEGTQGGFPHVVYGAVAGNDNAFFVDNQGLQIIRYDYTANSEHVFSFTPPQNPLVAGFAPVQQHVLVTDVAQKIYVFDLAGALLATIDTLRSGFNGVAARYNSVDGQVYVAGGNDNTVCVINPATNTFVIKTGFDVPVDFVFTASKKFAVQAGSTPLKEIV